MATDVASPPVSGGDLPSFDELLAKGSFHARLARARVEREKALARSGDAVDDEFILNTGRKPWEKGPGSAPKKDRLTDALRHSVSVEDRSVRPVRPPVPSPQAPDAPVPPPAILTNVATLSEPLPDRLPPLAPAESLVVVPAKFTRKRTQIAAGFGAGLVLGAAAAVMVPLLQGQRDAPVPVVLTPVAPVSVAQAPAVGAAAPVLAALSAVVEPVPVPDPSAPRPLPALVVRPAPPQAADAAPEEGRTGPLLATAAPFGFEAPAAALQAPPARPSHVELAAARLPVSEPAVDPSAADGLPSIVAAPPPRPRIDPRATDLATLASPDPDVFAAVAAAAVAGWSGPPLGRLTAPRDAAGDVPLSAQSLPAAYSAPDLPGTTASAATLFAGPVILHAPESVADAALTEIVSQLGAAGVPVGEPTRVGFTVSESNVRYFHFADAEAATAIAEAIGARLRDFTSFDPSPPTGTIEVWLAGRGNATAAAVKKSNKQTRGNLDQRLLNLRNRILRQLRNGDHL
ncbi:hypothetical protein [Defluviimonas sp. SAOS-178_SWC]|uniref:hypothetical protein n=1 Tax=Defluviimonas sp. SAOS-178_SWC TaxID=3121287 RepID=UPI003221DB90